MSCKIKVGNFLSKTIKTNKSVRHPTHENPNIGINKHISCLLWADDLVFFSKTEEGLQNMISKLSNYTKQNGLNINREKTKCMVFNKTGKLIRRNFYCDNIIIETVREYKYLGFLITPSGEITTGLKDLKSRAIFALTQLRTKMGVF